PLSSKAPWLEPAIDWEATIAYREHLWSWGLGIAEAMDTAQRGMGLDWPTSLELIRRPLDAAQDVPGAFVASGAGTDHLKDKASVSDVICAYEAQCSAIEKLGGRIIVMASRALAACAKSPEDYARVYDRILSQVKEPVIIHWLGEMFDPALEGYWGRKDHAAAKAAYHETLAPTVALSRHIFRAPTRFYKTGVVFVAWLNGHQGHFVMVGGQQSARHLLHFCELFRLADAAGLLSDPPLACSRM